MKTQPKKMNPTKNKVLEILTDQILDIERVITINQDTGSPQCPRCKKDLEISNKIYVVCKNPNCVFFKNFWYLFKFFIEQTQKSK